MHGSQRDEGYSSRNGKFGGKEVFFFRKAGRLGRKGKGPPGWTPADASAVEYKPLFTSRRYTADRVARYVTDT